ncbi:MAG: phenylacetate--CoA ligase family protein [Armatimonadota bacterium]
MHPALVRHVVFPFFQWRMGRRFGHAVNALERSQWQSAAQLREIQWTKARALLTHAFRNVPYYRALFRDLGAHPEDFRSLDDLARLPVLSKQVLRDRGHELIAEGVVRLSRRKTSGSTGIPMQTYIDSRCWAWWLAAEKRSRRWWGVEIGDRGGILTTYSPARRRRLKLRYLLNEGLFSCVDLSEPAMDHVYRQIVRFRPAFLYGESTTTLAHFAQFVLDHGGGAALRLKAIFCTGEVLYPQQRAVLARAFNCPVVNEYGSSENWLVAAECPQGRMHIVAENIYVEFQPVTAEDEAITEIVLTDLNNYGMPLIRYAIGDLGDPRDAPCPCGRGLPVLEVKGGRTSDLAVMPDGRPFDNMVLCGIFEGDVGVKVRQYRIVQESPDRFTVLVAADPSEAVTETIRQGFRDVLGPRPSVAVQFVPEIPRDHSGKLRHFVSRMAPPALQEREEGVPLLS